MSITIDQAFQIFMADRETSCVDKTLMYYQENLTNFFIYVSGVFNRPTNEIDCEEITLSIFGNVPSSRIILFWNRPQSCCPLPASGHIADRSKFLPISVKIMIMVMILHTRLSFRTMMQGKSSPCISPKSSRSTSFLTSIRS